MEEEAWMRLRERLGSDSRHDCPAAPARDLLWARQGTAYFARKLNELSDSALDAPSLIPCWTRRHVVAHIGYQARSLARLAEAARKGMAKEVLVEPEHQNENVEFGATLPAHALRYLFQHSAVHLNVEWRDLSDSQWQTSVLSLKGDLVPLSRTPWSRATEIWRRAIDLDNGGSLYDLPSGLRDEAQT
ncbi:maleylpyruvate isomerase N-terminal domain-containing protein [Bradyrhizobium sp. CCBAU 53340]|uniref:maleylpyruvate isomerase N-terminal domain-containing protein n=1 Tax=Bradyrhizobium sp. CCBAU 53340 TaxID=1325112 RepID=UPI00188BB00F|nr:maleylpyruvate isomerase N-terminal domain-containing protein [Bradyrhizobium sp. CCBAU 53340]